MTSTAPRWSVGGTGTKPLRLYCFPHGGGSAAEYVRWGRAIAGVDLVAVQLPGRGSRISEPGHTAMEPLVSALVAEADFVAPFAFFGHSLGAVIAYEVTHALRAAGLPLPRRLVVSSFPAPHLPRGGEPVRTLPDDQLLDVVQRTHGGLPAEVLDHPEIRALAAVSLRADYSVLETYQWREREPLPIPLTVYAGQDEPLQQEELCQWQRHSTEPVTVRTWPGGHFYLRNQRQPLVQRALAAALRTSTSN
ncbi:thioesterase II family protein [Streptomyces sp. NPDC021098]|uniref:thioesterase II family protein n=1 Tax=unclassified Streptomyces TaxID=2593676 RepID=UPI0037A4BB32